jgi:hypothetical protein
VPVPESQRIRPARPSFAELLMAIPEDLEALLDDE